MALYYLWIKAIHVVFMVTWFAGLFYLPRLFIYHVQSADRDSRIRFTTMERRLFTMMTIGAVLTVVAGSGLLWINPAIAKSGWFHVKLGFVIGLSIYHYRCWLWIHRLQHTDQTQDSKWLRLFNEIPIAFLLGIVILAIVKPF